MKGTPPEQGLHQDASELHRALSDLIRVFKYRDRKSVGFHDISVTQCHALDSLVRRDSMTLGQLSAELFLDKSTTSRVIDSLVRKVLATRTVDPQDARMRRLAATNQGRRPGYPNRQ